MRISGRTSGPLALGQEFNGTSHTKVLKDSVGALGGLAAFNLAEGFPVAGYNGLYIYK